MQVRGPGTCQARFCSFAQGASAHFLGVALSLMDSCEFSGSDSASVTVEGPPVAERNWACKHLAALVKTMATNSMAMTTTEGLKEGTVNSPSTAMPPAGPVPMETWISPEPDKAGGPRGGGGGVLLSRGTVLDEGWTEGDLKKEDEEEAGGMKKADVAAYSLSYEAHGLAHLWERGDERAPEEPGLRSLGEELQMDADAQMLVAAVHGCVLRHCLLRDGKGGVHMCNHAHARLEANVFTRLHYAVRCIQNAKVSCCRK